ncbi:hypothetical protein AVEN_50209-1 [Araneus ventricosus]|uniref:Uncharacterized protein n=1 Tax=Araneus ventricosus TaxID=182803 RepID=A0A4Y2RPU6_ARAVE|nr:hypothetical protein AVEN_50209-1 [Araneus ventricosus]
MDIVLQADKFDELSNVRVGGFHLLMSYMGAEGKIIGCSGLEEIWYEEFYVQKKQKNFSKIVAYQIFLTIVLICGLRLAMKKLSTSDDVDNTIEITSNNTVKDEINGN